MLIIGVRRGIGGQILVDRQGPPLGVEGLWQAACGGEVGAEVGEDLGQPRPVLGVRGVLDGQALEDLTGPSQVAQGVVDAARHPLGVGELLEDVGRLGAERLAIGVFGLEPLQDRPRRSR